MHANCRAGYFSSKVLGWPQGVSNSHRATTGAQMWQNELWDAGSSLTLASLQSTPRALTPIQGTLRGQNQDGVAHGKRLARLAMEEP